MSLFVYHNVYRTPRVSIAQYCYVSWGGRAQQKRSTILGRNWFWYSHAPIGG